MDNDDADLLTQRGVLVSRVLDELERAQRLFPPFHSVYEGQAVIFRELDALWDCIKSKDKTWPDMEKEAIQLAAMALRFVIDLEPEDG